MPEFLIAPTEPVLLKQLGAVSSMPENFGADVFWAEPAVGGLIGVQRKEFSDLIHSVTDGRLSKEVAQLAAVDLAVLVVEGRPNWTRDGELAHGFIRWTRNQYRNLLRSVQFQGIIVEHTDSLADTVGWLESFSRWAAKPEHTALSRRPKPAAVDWGSVSDKRWACHLLQSVPGVGAHQAEAIWDHFGGKLPIGLTCSRDELAQCPGIGPKRVEALVRAFGACTVAQLQSGTGGGTSPGRSKRSSKEK